MRLCLVCLNDSGLHALLDHVTCVKVDVPYLVNYLNRRPISKGYVVRCGSKNIYKKDTCLENITLHAQI